jgi:signal transduction histidine kinase
MVAVLAFLTLAVLLGSWFRTGWRSASSEAAALREQPLVDARQELGDLALELASRLDSLRAKEDARPYYHYQNLFHDPRGLSEGKSVSPSPLVEETGDPLISVHFQIDLEGTLTIPPVNEELEQFSQQESLALNLERLSNLRKAQRELTEEPVLVAALGQAEAQEPTPEPPQQQKQQQQKQKAQQAQQMPQGQMVQQQQFSQQAFVQNTAPNAVFQELKQRGKKVGGAAPPGAAAPEEPIEVSTHSFVWRAAKIDEDTELLAVRRIQTPAGDIHQGFVVGTAELDAWLKSRAGDFKEVALVRGEGGGDDKRSVAVPAIDGWQLLVDTREAERAAANRADGVGKSFLWRFIPSALVSLLLCITMVVAVSRAEEIARERSQFAAAAAHELRTPLAGLQLYGDMLADGLGDQNAKEKYARHISDEAQRLGRVVSNVLGFSQMERKGVNLNLCEGNLAAAVSQVVERMRPALEETGMEIESTIPDELQAVFDEDALSRILQNLMDNAEKYSREHEDRRLGVTVEEEPGIARVTVSDGGPGVLTQKHQQIFKPFKRNTDEDGPAGLGLGLALAQSLARQQGGDLRIEDSPFGGASFVLELPRNV